MATLQTRTLQYLSVLCRTSGILAFATATLFSNPMHGKPQSDSRVSSFVTPSTVVILVGESATLSLNESTGRPAANVEWSISAPIAELHVENGEVRIEGRRAGRAVLSATPNNQTSTATISVISGSELPPGTVRWSLRPMPGFETLFVMQAVPATDAPTFYSVEWSRSTNALVRALSDTGQQLWMANLTSSASPLTLKHTLPPPGEVFQNEQLLSDHSMFIIGDKNAFAGNSATDPSAYNLPRDGKRILLRAAGENSGGLILLERGRFRDSLVDLSPTAGIESWRFNSEGRLAKEWTVNYQGDIGIVETLAKPPSSALLIIDGKTGLIRYRVPFPVSSSTIDGFRCTDPHRNILKSVRPSPSGSVFTSSDSNVYVQLETHIETQQIEACKNRQYSFDDSLSMLRVTPDGQTEWKKFQHVHADGDGDFVVQPRVFAGESIPDGFGGVLAAWTYFFPGSNGEKVRTEARLTRIGPSGQQDFILPMPFWAKGLSSAFDQNMVLGEGNPVYATNGQFLLRFDTEAGVLNWVRNPPTGEVKLQHSTAGGGVLVSNAGRFVYFDPQGNGQPIPWTVALSSADNIGLVQTDIFDHSPMRPLELRDVQLYLAGEFIAVEDGAPNGQGALIKFTAK